MATVKSAEMVSIASLSKSIDKAVALAAQRHGATLAPENVVFNWEILGRYLRELKDPVKQTRLDVATTIMKEAGVKGRPVVTRIGKDVLVGFIERAGRVVRF